MIIREIIMWLSIMRTNLKDFPEIKSDSKIKALGKAIEIIHKYQKIEEIVAKWKTDAWIGHLSYDCMVKISEVLEDGNRSV